MEKKLFKIFFMIIIVWFLLCQIHVIYHYAITIYRNEWILGKTREEVEMRYGEPEYREDFKSLYERPNCLNRYAAGAEFINALRIIPFYPGKGYYMVIYDDDIACWAGYRNRNNAGD